MAAMNPLLFANLRNQRRLLESGTAYATARLLINVLFCVAVVGNVVGGFVLVVLVEGPWSAIPGGAPSGMVFAFRALVTFGTLLSLAVGFASWLTLRAFFDIADACIAISLQRPEEPTPALQSSPSPRPSPAHWPEPPKPLIPIPEPVNPQDAKYMPKK